MVKTLKIFTVAVVAFMYAGTAEAVELSSGSYTLYPDVIASGGASTSVTTGSGYDLVGTLGQTVVYNMASANNLLYGGFWNESTLGIFPPAGSVTIGAGTGYITSLAPTLTLIASDADGTVDEMRFTDDGDVSDDLWIAYTTYATHTFTDSTEGVKTIHAQFKDNEGNLSLVVLDTTYYDITPPTDGSVTTSTGNSVNILILSGFTDGQSGIGSYQVLMDQTAAPLSCASGTLLHDGPIIGNEYYHYGAINGETYYYRVCATDMAGNQSAGITTGSVSPSTSTVGISYPSGDDTSALKGVERTDQGTDSNNLDINTSQPKLDTNYLFQIVYKTDSGTGEPDPLAVHVFISDRTDGSNFQAYELTCTGSFSNGAYCSTELKLGPATSYKYYFRVTDFQGNFITDDAQTGPSVELLNGYTMLGLSRDITLSGTTYDGLAAFNNADTLRWTSTGLSVGSLNYGSYSSVDTGSPVINGEGYFVNRLSNTVIPELASLPDVTANSVRVTLTPGWNIISNPYNKHINLSDVQINRVGDPNLISWTTATGYGIVINAIYYYQGSDWGSTYGYESAGAVPDAKLAPWLGYWVYLTQTDTTYELVFTKP